MLGRRIAMLRKQKELSQYDLAERLGFSRGKLANYEQGSRQPDYDTLKKIADYFEVSADYLIGRTDQPDGVAEPTAFDEEDEEFQKFINDPENGLWFKEVLQSSEEQINELRRYWEFIKDKEKDRKPGDKQK